MKKSISLLVVLALILGVFWHFGGSSAEDATEEDALAVAVVVSSAFGDKSFNDSALEGAERLKTELGVNVSYIECHNEGYKQKLMDAAEGAEVVVAVGMECYEIAEVAPEFPDTRFLWLDHPAEGIADIPNLLCITYAQNEGSYLAGYIAASMSETGVIGAVGGEDVNSVNDFMKGYSQGAKRANKDIKVKTVYAEGYNNPESGKACALELTGEGADVIFNVAGNSGTGIFQAAKENGFYAIGVDSDQKLTCPEYDEVILCSMKKEIGQSIYDTVVAYMEDGTWNGAKVVLSDMKSGHISIAYGDENSVQLVSDELKTEVEELAEKIMKDKIKVKTAR